MAYITETGTGWFLVDSGQRIRLGRGLKDVRSYEARPGWSYQGGVLRGPDSDMGAEVAAIVESNNAKAASPFAMIEQPVMSPAFAGPGHEEDFGYSPNVPVTPIPEGGITFLPGTFPVETPEVEEDEYFGVPGASNPFEGIAGFIGDAVPDIDLPDIDWPDFVPGIERDEDGGIGSSFDFPGWTPPEGWSPPQFEVPDFEIPSIELPSLELPDIPSIGGMLGSSMLLLALLLSNRKD